MSWRALELFLQRLPGESQFRTEVRDSLTDDQWAELLSRSDDDTPSGPWSRQELLTAEMISTLRQLLYVQIAKSSKNPKDVRQPEPVRTPGPRRPIQKVRSADPRALAYLQDIRDRHKREAG